MAPFIQLKEANYILAREGSRGLKQQIARNLTTVATAIAGSAIGGPIGMMAGLGTGLVAGPALAAPLTMGVQAAKVPVTLKTAEAFRQIGSGALPGHLQQVGSNIIRSLGRNIQRAVPAGTRATQEWLERNELKEFERGE